MNDHTVSIEGQVLVKSTAEIVAACYQAGIAPTEEFISKVFESLEKNLDSYKKKHQGNP